MNSERKDSSKGSFITPGYTLPFILVTSLFFMWAIPHNLNDVRSYQTKHVSFGYRPDACRIHTNGILSWLFYFRHSGSSYYAEVQS